MADINKFIENIHAKYGERLGNLVLFFIFKELHPKWWKIHFQLEWKIETWNKRLEKDVGDPFNWDIIVPKCAQYDEVGPDRWYPTLENLSILPEWARQKLKEAKKELLNNKNKIEKDHTLRKELLKIAHLDEYPLYIHRGLRLCSAKLYPFRVAEANYNEFWSDTIKTAAKLYGVDPYQILNYVLTLIRKDIVDINIYRDVVGRRYPEDKRICPEEATLTDLLADNITFKSYIARGVLSELEYEFRRITELYETSVKNIDHWLKTGETKHIDFTLIFETKTSVYDYIKSKYNL